MNDMDIIELQDEMSTGEKSSRAIIESYLDRIRRYDEQGPKINSIIELNPEAITAADSLDKERKEKGPRGPFHGIPILIKANIDTADKMATTAGSLALKGSIASQDAFLVKRLREAGAIILGKTNLSEWANMRSNRSTSGWSSRGGLTRNPYVLDRNPSGSSSGSAAAVAANFCAAAIGTETDGSIVSPASANSVVGLKPSLGLISRSGIIPIAHSQDTAGPLTRTVEDAAIMLSVLTGPDPRDPITQEGSVKGRTDYSEFLDKNGLEGARIGVARNFFGSHRMVDQIVESAIKRIKQLGAALIDPANVITRGQFRDSEFEVLLYEFKHDLNEYLAALGPEAKAHSLKEVIEFNEQNKETVMPYFGQEAMLLAEAKGPLTDSVYLEALEKNRILSRDEGIDATLKEHNLDAIIAPTAGLPCLTDLVNGDSHRGGCSSPAAVAGYPHITVPAGYAYGLPVGLSFFGGALQEPALLKFAYAFEQSEKIRRPPEFKSTADI
ncbi:MAG: amidase [Candidatus Adiutricales bacterium]